MINQVKDYSRGAAIAWAKQVTNTSNALILDSETTGLDRTAQIVELSIINTAGETLFDQRFKPTVSVHSRAAKIHGLTDEVLSNYPPFSEFSDEIWELISGRDLIIYNKAFDYRLLIQTAGSAKCYMPPSMEEPSIHCAMMHYGAFAGSKQKLPSGDHSALGDCKATLKVIEMMAGCEL